MRKTGTKKPKTRPRNVQAVDRRRRAMEMRLAGASLQAIADALGMSVSSVHETIQVGLRESLQPASDELREMELQRLDVLWKSLQKGVKAGEADSVRAAVRVMEQRARLLGLYSSSRGDTPPPAGAAGSPLSLVVDTMLVNVNAPPAAPTGEA